MRVYFGLFLILLGICLGVYMGFYVCFIGGIMDIINQVRAETVDTWSIIWAVLRISSSSFVGAISAFLLILPGWKIADGKL